LAGLAANQPEIVEQKTITTTKTTQVMATEITDRSRLC
jgi:hypothetical protein